MVDIPTLLMHRGIARFAGCEGALDAAKEAWLVRSLITGNGHCPAKLARRQPTGPWSCSRMASPVAPHALPGHLTASWRVTCPQEQALVPGRAGNRSASRVAKHPSNVQEHQ